ncbi:NACHT domain-containing protein [Prauserella marina]|uniref:NACHT domain-containing protein n=1 Tax=Prauserella marina TaxID=530584 RepID=A0A1G6TGT2_9PSEU|nr:NACHT domain-containing protein [Prauserella marina]PWV75702.1 NACHT domain-containing protein [Prauserella marina]SDD28372.1 NACHT domain-containing protein [Prauserella marina]
MRRRTDGFERSASLAELAEAELKSPLRQRKLANLVEHIGFQVGEQLAEVLATRFAMLPANEAEAAVLAAVDVLGSADLSDEAIFAADADAERLATTLRAEFPDRPHAVALGEAAWPLYELALDQCCRYLVQVVRHLPSFQPRALADVLGRLSAQSQQLTELLARTPRSSLHAPSGTGNDGEFRAEYLRLLARTLDNLELVGLPVDAQPRIALTPAYLSLSVSAERGYDREAQGDWFEQQDERRPAEGVPVETAIGRSWRTLVRGDAGSGKTTLLNWLCVTAAGEGFTGALASWNGKVPFPVRLRSFARGALPGPEDLVAHAAKPIAGLMPAGWAHRMLASGDGLLLVDGVDEVTPVRRKEVKAWLRELVDAFPSMPVVVTARTAAADHRWLAGQRFTTVTLEPMNATATAAFVDRWHTAAESGTNGTSADFDAAKRRLRKQLERPRLRQLAESPLLCAMLCALNFAHRSELPRDRMELYGKALAMLLHLRDAERGIAATRSTVGPVEQRVLLRDLAWRLTLANRIELAKDDTLTHLAAKLPAMPNVDSSTGDLLDHLLERSGVLREPVPGRIDFVHRTFQEYLAADEAVQQHHIPTLVAHAHLDTWQETVVMAAGHATARQAGELVTGVLDRADENRRHARKLRLVAAACLETIQDIDPLVHERVEKVIADHLVPPRSVRETASLAAIGHRVLRYLPDDLGALSGPQAAACVRAATLAGTDEALELLARYAKDPRGQVFGELNIAWEFFDPATFAERVLSRAPLGEGRPLVASSRKSLEHAGVLGNLEKLVISLPAHELVTDLAEFDDAPVLRYLDIAADPAGPLDLAPLGRHDKLSTIGISGATHYTGLSTLHGLRRLRTLRLLQLGSWRDIEFVTGLDRLGFLTLDHIGELADLDILVGAQTLTRIALYDFEGATIANSKKLEQVTRISLQRPAPGFDLGSAVRTFPNVGDANLGFLDDPDLGLLHGWPLTDLLLRRSVITDLRPLATLPSLNRLFLANVRGDPDLSPLADKVLELRLARGDDYPGLDKLGPGVTVRYVD